MVCYAEKQVKPFWCSSLGQMVQFDTIIFCRTFKNYFGQFVWIEKKVTIIVAFHFMKRRLKIVWTFGKFEIIIERLGEKRHKGISGRKFPTPKKLQLRISKCLRRYKLDNGEKSFCADFVFSQMFSESTILGWKAAWNHSKRFMSYNIIFKN